MDLRGNDSAKEIRIPDTKKAEIAQSKNKFYSLLNILILILATLSIAAFIFYFIENRINSIADKDSSNEEIIENLYRNVKYQFRIKFPKNWEIQKGDGPNILVKAISSRGSNINIYVKDLGVSFGDISELFTLKEWSQSVIEKFPSAQIIEMKEIRIDNRKALYVKYKINYEALDKSVNMTMYSVALTNSNFLYAMTAGAESNSFENEESTLNESIRTFVLEDFQNDSPSQEITEQSEEQKESEEDLLISQPWFRNSLYGVSFETPQKLTEEPSTVPKGYEQLIIESKTHFLQHNGLMVFFMFFESKFDTYDKKVGLSSSIGNMVNSFNGTNLNLQYTDPSNNLDDLNCSGTYMLDGTKVNVKGYVYWNRKGKFFILTTMGDDPKDIITMDKIFKSIRVAI